MSRNDVLVSADRARERIGACFVLRELLGEKTVKNYAGSWTEYGSLVPIEKGA